MAAYLEHANMTVNDTNEAVEFLQTALPEFRVRGEGVSSGRKWIHIGTDDSYITLNQANTNRDVGEYSAPGVNHLGLVVDDAERVAAALRSAGYREGMIAEAHPHRRRVYFYDRDNNEWEFVQYYSDRPEERNSYE